MPCGMAQKFFKKGKEKGKKGGRILTCHNEQESKERIPLSLCRMTYNKDLGANGRAVVLGHVQTGLSGTVSVAAAA